MYSGLLKPEISAAFTVAPAVVYSPIVLLLLFVTNRSEPDTATPDGSPTVKRDYHPPLRSN
jgi:hypothetical protein